MLFVPRLVFYCILNLKAYYKLLNFANDIKPDIIHSNVSVVDVGYRVAKKINTPHVWHIREYGDFDFNFAPSYKAFISHLNDDINHCLAITKGVKEHHHLSDNKCRVIYDGVLSLKESRSLKEKSDYFLFAGRLEEAKGIELCIKGYVRFWKKTKSKISLKIAGDSIDPSYSSYLKTLANGAPIEFLGMKKDIYNIMLNAKALIVSSRHEGFGFITAEAMFNDCLVIGRNTNGTKEQMDNGISCTGKEIALRFITEEELSERLFDVYTKGDNYYMDMRKRAQYTVEKLYTAETHTARVLDYYETILKS